MPADTRPPRGRYSPQDIAILSDLMGRLLTSRGGQSMTAFGGDRDYNVVLGLPVDISFAQFEVKYRRQDIARPIITAKPGATWKDDPELRFVEDAATSETAQTAFLAAWASMAKRVRLYERLRRADVRAGLGQYSVIVLGVKGRGSWPSPLKRKAAANATAADLVYLAVYDEIDARIEALDTNRESERYNLPEFYEVNTAGEKMRTHWTRVIHVAEDCEKDDVMGTPRLEACYNLLEALMKVVHGGAETVWHDMVGTFHADVREGYELTTADEEKLTGAIDDFLNGLRRVIRTEGIDLEKLPGQVIDPSALFNVAVKLICATTQIPYSILIGSDRGDVGKTEESRQWAGVIKERRRQFADPLVRTMIERLVDYGILPAVDVDEIELVWKPIIELSDLERADLAEARGRAVSAVSTGSSPDVYISPAEFRDWLGLEGRAPKEAAVELLGLRSVLARIAKTLTDSGASLYAAALVAGFTEKEAKALTAWAAPPPVKPPPPPADTTPTPEGETKTDENSSQSSRPTPAGQTTRPPY